jgi:riboflavin synthase
MFTGIIEVVGRVASRRPMGRGIELEIATGLDLSSDTIGDSVAVDGVCLTMTKINGDVFSATASSETITRSTLGQIRPGERVNIERALTLSSRLGGHIVLGHVDTVGSLLQKDPAGESIRLKVRYDRAFSKYAVEKGSISIHGVSLTINELQGDSFTVNIIPYTAESTSLTLKSVGDRVNLEFDVIGKYVENLLHKDRAGNLEDLLRKQGFLAKE